MSHYAAPVFAVAPMLDWTGTKHYLNKISQIVVYGAHVVNPVVKTAS
ncbi:MAG: hypothetical protein H6R00_952 [Proteobacteria bacterium]|nr:hypothetical protein [Pseudomonadota bacterium]